MGLWSWREKRPQAWREGLRGKSPEKQGWEGTYRCPPPHGEKEKGRDRRAEEEEKGTAPQLPAPPLSPGALQPGPGGRETSASHLPLLLASSESCSLNYG